MKYEDEGIIEITGANDMNVPVNSFLLDPRDSDSGRWVWLADNFMPRKGRVTGEAYKVTADDRETLIELVRLHVVPLYQAALNNLQEDGQNYYWE